MRIRFELLCLLTLTSLITHAAGPYVVDNGLPVSYIDSNIVLNFDQGMLDTLSNSEADTLVNNAIAQWNAVSTSSLTLTQGNDLDFDVDETNFQTLVPSGTANDPAITDSIEPVIYDNNGQIIDALLGAGNSSTIGGIAASSYYIGQASFASGYVVINGSVPQSDIQRSLIIMHEIGHYFGADHSQAHINNNEVANTCPTTPRSEYPAMYPVICRDTVTLNDDDIVSVSSLYPVANLEQQMGQLTGVFLQNTGAPILGANIWLEKSTGEHYSVVSDYLKLNTGFFSLWLPPGSYTLHANSINTDFTLGSGIGPYTTSIFDRSFTFPNPITPVTFQGNTGNTQSITINTGEATDVRFYLDGSGIVATGQPIFTPSTPNDASSGGSGQADLTILFLLAASLLLLRYYLYRLN